MGLTSRGERRASSGQGVDSGVSGVICAHLSHAAPPSPHRALDLRALDHGPQASARICVQDGTTGLITASENGHVQTIELLLDRRADIHATGGEVICARHAYAGGQVEQGSPPALAGIRCVVCVCVWSLLQDVLLAEAERRGDGFSEAKGRQQVLE